MVYISYYKHPETFILPRFRSMNYQIFIPHPQERAEGEKEGPAPLQSDFGEDFSPPQKKIQRSRNLLDINRNDLIQCRG